jgi:hypothetical protein
MHTTIFISFYNSYPITSGASAVTTSLFLNWPTRTKLFQLNHQNIIKKKNIYNFKIKSSHPIFKILYLIPFSIFILKNIDKKKTNYIIFEGASWSGYTYIVYIILTFFLKKKKYIYHSHNVDFYFRKKNIVIRYLSFFFEKKILREFDISTSVSKQDQDKFKKIYGTNTVLLPNGIAIENKYLIKKSLGNYIFFPGSLEFLENKKNFVKLLNNEFLIVKKIIPNVKIYQSGGGESKYFSSNPNVKELGTLSRKNYLKYLQRALMIIVPSSSYGPGTKIKVIEALCYNKNLLVSKYAIKGIKSLFHKEIVYSNINQFRRKIILLNKNKFQTTILKKMGLFYRKHHNIKNIIKKFYEEHI